MCRSIVSGLGGTIELESEIGSGSSFTVRLPVAVKDQSSTPAQVAPDVDDRVYRVLLVDDDPRVARAIERMLRPHEVVWAKSGVEAVALLGHPFDVVLCDILMPEMSGPELYARVKNEFPQRLDGLVFVTGGAFSTTAETFLRDNDPVVVMKPFTRDQLIRVIREVVGEAHR